MISYVISLMKACLLVRAFAWKEVSTETLPDSCPDPLLFLLFSRRFPALSLLLGLLRLHQIEQLLFRVDLKLGIEMPRMRRPGQHVLRALLRQPGLFRRPCPWLRRVRGQRHQRVSGLNPETSLSAIPLFQPLPYKKRPTLGAARIKQHKNVFRKRRSFGYAVSPFCRSISKDAGSIPTRS